MADRQKLIDVFMHMGDHIRNLDEYGICYDSTLAEAIEDVVALLKIEQTFATDNNVGSKWIPVSERLPNKGVGQVLVVKQYRGKQYIDIGEILEGKAFCYSDDYCVHPREHILTHWMPLPEPPKEE